MMRSAEEAWWWAMMNQGEGRLLVAGITGASKQLWRINPDNPSDTSGVYGKVGDFHDTVIPVGMTWAGYRLLAATSLSELWRINPDNPSDTSGVYGKIGDFPSGLDTPGAMTWTGDRLLIAKSETSQVENGELWRINPDNPSDTSGVYGKVGDFPTVSNDRLSGTEAMTWTGDYLLVYEQANGWRINPDNPSDTSGVYGRGPIAKPLAHATAYGMTRARGHIMVVYKLTVTSVRELWRINPNDLADTSGIYGKVGNFPNGFAVTPLSAAWAVV